MHHFEAMKSSNVHFTFFRMGKILEGLLAGAVEAEVPHGVECLRDAKHIWERFGGVIDQLTHASFNSVLHAVEDLGHIIHDIANELEECKATVGTDLDKLREMSKAFTDPWYFIFHVEHDLIVNGQDVHHEIMDAEAQWENQHFYEFGHSVGLGLSKIFLGGQMKNDIPRHYLPTHGEHNVHGEGHYADTMWEHARSHEPLYHESRHEESSLHHESVAHHDVTPHEALSHHEDSHYNDFYSHHEEPVHHELVHELSHEHSHEYHHEDPHVYHEHPVHHEEPVHHYPHHEEYHQEEPHVEFEHEAHSGPVHHEYHTVIPHHEHVYESTHGVHYEPEQLDHELGHHYYAEHETAHSVHHEPEHSTWGYEHSTEYVPTHHALEGEHQYREAAHHFYQ